MARTLCRTLSLEPSSPWTSCARSRYSVPGCSGVALARDSGDSTMLKSSNLPGLGGVFDF